MPIAKQLTHQVEPHMSSFTPDSETSNIPLFDELEQSVGYALETYANVHRGSGHASMVSTQLYETARSVVLSHLNLSARKYQVIFCSPGRATLLAAQLPQKTFQILSSRDMGLAVGIRALVAEKRALKKIHPDETGGGAARMIARDWIVWEGAPERFESGTPAIINVIAFVRALQLLKDKPTIQITPENRGSAQTFEHLFNQFCPDDEGETLLAQLRSARIGKDMPVPTVQGQQPFVNLDNSASTPTFKPIWDTFRFVWRQPPSVQKQIVDSVRDICAEFLQAPKDDYETFFTCNTTEAVNITARCLPKGISAPITPVVVSSVLEHSSNDLPWRDIPNVKMEYLEVDDHGFLDLQQLQQLLDTYNVQKKHGNHRIVLVAVTGASNVLGTCNDIIEISQMAHRHDARVFVDAAQLVAHREIRMRESDIDFLAFSAHKVYAPFGAGALVIKKRALNLPAEKLAQLKRNGEENAAGIAALGTSLSLLSRIGMKHIAKKELVLTQHALNKLAQIPGIRIQGICDSNAITITQKVGVIPFYIDGVMPATIANGLARSRGIGVRYGCHCSHVIVKRLHKIGPRLERVQRVIAKFVPALKFQGVIRASFGLENTAADVDALVQTLEHLTSKSNNTDKPKRLVKKEIAQFVDTRIERVFPTKAGML